MKHDDIRHKLSEYLDGSVTDEEKKSIEDHLKSCAACGDALRDLQKTVGHIKSIEALEPPVWMTQKIMAHVRSAAEEQEHKLSGLLHPARAAAPGQKASALSDTSQQPAAPAPPKKESLLRRLFTPVLVNVPLQAVAVLFLAVTAFYIYRTIEPAQQIAESTREQPSGDIQKNAPPARKPEPSSEAPLKDQFRASESPALLAKKAPQSPEYKALDMKPEYERPAPPVRRELPAVMAPAPAAPAEQPATAGAPVLKEQRAPAAGAFSPMDKQEQGEAAIGAASQAEDTSIRHLQGKRKSDERSSELSRLKSASVATGDEAEAAAQKRIVEYFTSHDLPQSMKVKGLKYTVAKLPPTPSDRLQFDTDAKKTEQQCTHHYRIDVVLDNRQWQYLYCMDNSAIRLLGTYELQKDRWIRIH